MKSTPVGSAPPETAPAPEPVTGVVQRAVAQVHAVADPVLEQVPEPTQQHAEGVTHTVDRVAETVDEVTGGLLP